MDPITSSVATFYYIPSGEKTKPVDVREDIKRAMGTNRYDMLSPEQLSRSRTATIATTGTNANANLIWTDAQVSDFSSSFFLDTSEVPPADQSDINAFTVVQTLIEKLWTPQSGKDGPKNRPQVTYVFGEFNFKGLLTKFDEKYTYFSEMGYPLRAEISFTMKRQLSAKASTQQGTNNQSRSVRVVNAGDRLDLIADDYYGDPAKWREIARENNIRSPRNFPQPGDLGRELLLPDLLIRR